MGPYDLPDAAWLALTYEDVIDPDRPIIDAHHHMWHREHLHYLLPELLEDVYSGHNVVATVYVDCRSMYRQEGPPGMRQVGEVEFANGIAAMSAGGGFGPARACAAIVSAADFELGAAVKPTLEAMQRTAPGRFRGIRRSSAWDSDLVLMNWMGDAPMHDLADERFCEAFACLAPLGLSFDAYVMHPQIPTVTTLARRFPDTSIILDHAGGPLGLGGYAQRRTEEFDVWRSGMTELATCPNVTVKLGGLGMNFFGADFGEWDRPPASDDLVAAWGPYVEESIKLFGAKRCMFESNFPPDKGSCSYSVMWNAFKKIAASCSEDEKHWLFFDTARQVYRIGDLAAPTAESMA
jgi:predicted TIM-barrel fold metal-dependent hydrolase